LLHIVKDVYFLQTENLTSVTKNIVCTTALLYNGYQDILNSCLHGIFTIITRE